MLIMILYCPAKDPDGTSASWNVLALCEWRCFDKVFFYWVEFPKSSLYNLSFIWFPLTLLLCLKIFLVCDGLN